MSNINLQKEWNFLMLEINRRCDTKRKPPLGHRFLVMQILLERIGRVKNDKEKLVFVQAYHQLKNRYSEQ